MPSIRHFFRASILAALLPCAAQADTVVLHAERATAGADPHTSARMVEVELKPESRKALADFTRERVGKRIQLRSNGVLLSSATLMSPLEGGSFRITAGEHGFEGKSADEIAQGIMKTGELTVDDENAAK
ncbi:MAG: SecDF P1 head subdomain-containing protein [Achromobacter sp.]|uniref:SecDF P1 head subdomain-containing protein n=1 Tax=Achromobacter sp. TaxID=134375 RepID=UPI003D08E60E